MFHVTIHTSVQAEIHKSENLFYGATFNSTLHCIGGFKFNAPHS